MSNFRKFISVTAVAMLGVTNLLTPLSYANAANLGDYDNITASQLEERTAKSFSFIMPAHDVWLYAVTAANHYFVDFNGHGETSGEMDPQEMVYDTEENLKSNAYGKTGYTFSGWNRAEDGSSTGYTNGQAVKNLTGVESGHVPLYAQWSANSYNIQYLMNDSGGTSQAVHNGAAGQNPTTLAYDQTGDVTHPSRTGYTFSGWQITNMDSTQHNIGDVTTSEESYPRTEAQSFKNLRATSGTVTFTALWDADQVKYVVKHFTEGFTNGDYTHLEDTYTGEAQADSEITAARNNYTGFSQPSVQTGIVNANGSTEFVYQYPRISYPLTLVPGRGIASVSASGTVTKSGPYANTGTENYKYNEAITLSLVEADGYENGRWVDTETGFNMPSHAFTGTAVADPIEYTITYNYRVADGERKGTQPNNQTTYNVESATINVINPARLHSQFQGWIGGVVDGEQLSGATDPLSISSGSIGDRVYYATWSCDLGYKLPTGSSGDNKCIPNTNTVYTIDYIRQDLDGGNTIIETFTGEGITDEWTGINIREYEGFTVDPNHATGVYIYAGGTGHQDITYTRNVHNITKVDTTGVNVTVDPQHSEGEATSKYGDTVTLSYETQSGYIFSGWEVTKSGGTVDLLSGGNSFIMPDSDVTIRPILRLDSYDITYTLNGGSVNGTNPKTYTVETLDFTLINPEREHSVFEGWSGTDIAGKSTSVTIEKGSVGDRTFEANWSCDAGYHIEGAGASETCEANGYTASYNLSGGQWDEHGPANTSFKYDVTGTVNNPVRSGYDFAGWTVTGLSGGNATVDGESYDGSLTTGTEFRNLTTTSGGTVVFEANWTARSDTEYLVIHYTEKLDGTFIEEARSEGSGETASTLTFTNLTGTFTGFTYASGAWSLGESGTQTPATSTTIDEKGRTVIHLYYTRNDYTVHLSGDEHATAFKINGDSKTSSGFKYGDTVEVSVEATEGYHFVKWEKRGTDFAKIGSGS